MKRYNPKEIEPKWQQAWADGKIYEASDQSDKPKRYVLEYFPYPSGAAMHVGHVRNYTIGDAIARHARMQGYNVLHPMGWDAFGLPAENYAIKNGISPQEAIRENTAKFKRQLTQMGFSYDWSREINSSDPDYYKWTQWYFLLLHKRGLAYQKESLQWWCPVDKTVLANEQVENGQCWRCGSQVEKKALKQWFFKITEYADRLAQDLDEVDWSDALKSMQRNWIGRSKGAEVDFAVDGTDKQLKIFTTRPDTLYGATFMVIAPEHPLAKEITTAEHRDRVGTYIKEAEAKSDVERQETNREKTGVFTGAYAVNPVNDVKIPIWVADYVLYGYGTGAIMAVPAHDERDHEFAKKFDLPIVPVLTPAFRGESYHEDAVDRPSVVIVARDPETDTYAVLDWRKDSNHEHNRFAWPGGGIDEGETLEQAAKREFAEETGYTDIEMSKVLPAVTSTYYDGFKPYQRSVRQIVTATLRSRACNAEVGKDDYEKNSYDVKWMTRDEILAQMEDGWKAIAEFAFNETIHVGEGVMINSGPYDNMKSEDVREKIVADLAAKGVAKERINYKIRDWLISRQRYWGAPIPIIHCPKDGAVPVPEDQLPVVLPEMKSFEPSGDGRSPLARVPEWVNTTCPTCGGPAERETDTMDGFACSSWYFLRFTDPHNSEHPADPAKVKYWMPVDDYIGGAEHAVMHLLYVRFWFKVMQDEGLVDFGEPIKTLRNHGMILAPDGQKMSKSKGNTIEPDGLIEQGYGADAIRIMELFIGPWNQVASWSVEGMGGSFRFLQRVWAIAQDVAAAPQGDDSADAIELKRVMHRTIKKVSEDLAGLSFNTAIAAMMQAVNDLYALKATLPFDQAPQTWRWTAAILQQLLAPFAPHITEELWQQLGHDTSVHTSDWPKYDEQYLASDTMTIAVQVNGKIRGEVQVASGAAQDEIVAAARQHEKVAAHLGGKEIKKTIYVPGKLVSFVV
ncbi:MAG TPA: leucine--tRNA ligase [Candidatus Saccharimonadales bacterium]|nr:leucine--tRNA ligase [Candidatus Saccharimonadales bacterium]